MITNCTQAAVWGELDFRDPSLSVSDLLNLLPSKILGRAIAFDNPAVASFHTNYDDRVIVGYGYTSAAAVRWHTLHFLLSSAFHNCSFHRNLFALLVHIKW